MTAESVKHIFQSTKEYLGSSHEFVSIHGKYSQEKLQMKSSLHHTFIGAYSVMISTF